MLGRALGLAVLLALSACCWNWPPWKCEDVNPHCNSDLAADGSVLTPDGGQPVDAATITVDAVPAPPEPSITDKCVAEWSGPACDADKDQYEPNNSMVAATYLAQCSSDALSASAGQQDVDVFRTGDCEFGFKVALGPVMPWAEIDQDPARPDDVSRLRICVFPTCGKGATNVYGCLETPSGVAASDDMPSVMDDLWRNDVGFRGCCRMGPGRITAEAECPRRSTTIDTYIWIEPIDHSEPACRPYQLQFNTSCTPPNCPW